MLSSYPGKIFILRFSAGIRARLQYLVLYHVDLHCCGFQDDPDQAHPPGSLHHPVHWHARCPLQHHPPEHPHVSCLALAQKNTRGTFQLIFVLLSISAKLALHFERHCRLLRLIMYQLHSRNTDQLEEVSLQQQRGSQSTGSVKCCPVAYSG